jgi:hypothetical protein
MVLNKPITSRKGGNFHPLRVVDFIVEYLAGGREASTTEMHHAYKVRMKELSERAGRKTPYRMATWYSFNVKVWTLHGQGVLTYNEQEEQSDAPQFSVRDQVTTRKLFRLAP